MTPEKSPLKVRLQISVLIGIAAGAVLVVGASRTAPEASQQLRQSRRIVRHERAATPEEFRTVPETKSATEIQTSEAVARVVPQAAAVSAAPQIPSAMEEDWGLLKEWILNLPFPDLQAFDASGKLNRCIVWIVGELSHANPDPQVSVVEIDRFLTMLNVRLGAPAP